MAEITRRPARRKATISASALPSMDTIAPRAGSGRVRRRTRPVIAAMKLPRRVAQIPFEKL